MDVFFSVLSSLLSSASLYYSFILFGRITKHQLAGTHVGSDVIFVAYLTSMVAFVMPTAVLLRKNEIKRFVKSSIFGLSAVALGTWIWLHISGKVISHTSMMLTGN